MDRTHRSLSTTVPKTSHSIDVEVKTRNADHVILFSQETGEFSWPLAKIPENLRDTLAPGDRLPLSVKTLDEMHELLATLVG